MCTGTYFTDYDINYQETTFYTKEIDFDSKDAEYRIYLDIENGKTAIAYTKPEYFEWKNEILTTEFEHDNIVLNPYNSNNKDNGYDEVRMNFFMNAIKYGQSKSKKLILEKYPRI